MDITRLEDLYYQAGVRYYNDNLKPLIKSVISDLYQANWPLLKNIQITHIDHAIFKYKEVSETKKIYNTKSYFRACLKSAIEELEINDL
jgi:hypothetical protein